jgi:uncharacterized protein (DUF2252 family)
MKSRELIRPKDRDAVLAGHRTEKMARSAHAYVRGSTVKFYEWLDAHTSGSMPEGPPVWICGDCHAGNLGPVTDAKGRVEIQIRDFDQAVIGNPAHDLIRLGLSLATASRGSDLPGVTIVRMLEQMIEGYEHALLKKDDEVEDKPEAVGIVMKRSIRRSWKQFARERIADTTPTLPLGGTFWPVSRPEAKAIKQLFAGEAVRRLATMLRSRKDGAAVTVMDAAYWRKGCSSLGRLRFAVLLKVGKGSNNSLSLMDVKEAIKAAAPRYQGTSIPRDNAERVVEGAKKLSPFLGERMLAAQIEGRSVFIRELLPQDLKLEIDQLTQDEAMKAARFLASVVGKAHARQMDGATRDRWHGELGRNRSKSLDAPSWLWSSIVDLVSSHESAYLEHCRRYALARATA